jgi:glycosyltransferase involved in cell wall biosynthesis
MPVAGSGSALPMFDPVVVIPVYNHGATALRTVARVRARHLRCIVVDDGCDEQCARQLERLRHERGTTLLRLPTNQGKGAAVIAGLREAQRQGRTHVLQIDADGQHNTQDINGFLFQARAHPESVICGVPRYDASAPLGRRISRYLTHFWVWVYTWSFEIEDSMCGFRVYPLAATLNLIDEEPVGQRMDFDTDILVRLHWRGVRVISRATPVTYPRHGHSNFRLIGDNLLITAMHTRLFFGMLRRWPTLLARWRSGRTGKRG